ncbi:4-coumarate--CoA ligase [Salvia divinorum]|uniref:4-coumarate--CoA ligase n=1 Tax=Salvia divinorum TaxID=28513 RepID=A0ABD1H4C2_SALDI
MMTSDQELYRLQRVEECFPVLLTHVSYLRTVGYSLRAAADREHGGGTVMGRYEVKAMLKAVERYKVTHLFVVPPVVLQLSREKETVKGYDVSTLREILSGAAPLGKDMVQACSDIFPEAVVCQAYGMTEATRVISIENRRMRSPHGGSVGALAPGVEAQIVDLETMLMGPATTNYYNYRLLLRVAIGCDGSPLVRKARYGLKAPRVLMKGYLNNEKATTEVIDEGEWLHTGDVGYFDEEGRLYVVDRVKELIKYKGFQVAPAELEELLITHPQIMDAAVIGLDDAEAGEIPIAYVVRSSLSTLTTLQVQQFIAEQVAPFKRVIFVKDIPRSNTGKILRNLLRQKLEPKL